MYGVYVKCLFIYRVVDCLCIYEAGFLSSFIYRWWSRQCLCTSCIRHNNTTEICICIALWPSYVSLYSLAHSTFANIHLDHLRPYYIFCLECRRNLQWSWMCNNLGCLLWRSGHQLSASEYVASIVPVDDLSCSASLVWQGRIYSGCVPRPLEMVTVVSSTWSPNRSPTLHDIYK